MTKPRAVRDPSETPPRRGWRYALREGGVMSLVLVALTAWTGTALWHSWEDLHLSQSLKDVVKPGDIRMISSETCPYCAQARRWMSENKIPFEECFVEQDSACAADYVRTGGRGTPTLLIRGQVQLGFNTGRLAKAFQAH